ncbi:MAG: sigma-70 family RNA polymerase sigma factor [Planctomycetes bacterium]|nr:sigma-70 family RNA polymerase sigma factor [Planctomycetota bacterium]
MSSDLPNLLSAIERGEAKASEELLPLVYAELRALASRQIARERVGATLQATALVHEAYLRLIGGEPGEKKWDGIGHFYAAAAESIRRILVERARARAALKRGGDRGKVTLGADISATEVDRDQLLDLDAALHALAAEDPRKARLVELRYFAGLSLAETAALLGISPATADRDWVFARAWLHTRLGAHRRSASSE